jgi:hypothetical protein
MITEGHDPDDHRHRWPTDLTRVCERLALRLRDSGAPHPVAAAVVLAARGHQGVDQATFADRHDLPVATVERAERGEIPWEDLPDIIGDLLEALPSVELLSLADLDTELRPRSGEASA